MLEAYGMPFSADLSLKPRLALAALVGGAVLAIAGVVWGPTDRQAESVLLAFALAWASAVDIDRFLLPNALTLGLAFVGLGGGALRGTDALIASALGAVIGYAMLAGAGWLYHRLRGRDGLGLGDAKLLGAAGAWLGWPALPTVLLLASCAALILVGAGALIRRKLDRAAPIAFGPFLAAGFWLSWTFDPLGLVRGLT